MQLKSINSLKSQEMKAKTSYDFPKYKITGTSDFWFGGIFGVKNAGKSNAVLNILNIEADIMLAGANKCYYFSPTKDSKLELFEEQHSNHFEIINELNLETFRRVVDEIQAKNKEWKEVMALVELLKKPKLTREEQAQLEGSTLLDTVDFKTFNFDHPNIHTMIFDDSMHSPMISSQFHKQGKEFIKFCIRHRHEYTNLFILSQHIRAISKPIRTNMNAIVIFPFRDGTIYQNVFQEYSTLFDNDISNFLTVMREIERRDNHSFLFIYYDKVRFVRIGFGEGVEMD